VTVPASGQYSSQIDYSTVWWVSGSPINQGHLFHQEKINIARHGLVGATARWYVRAGKSGTAGPQPATTGTGSTWTLPGFHVPGHAKTTCATRRSPCLVCRTLARGRGRCHCRWPSAAGSVCRFAVWSWDKWQTWLGRGGRCRRWRPKANGPRRQSAARASSLNQH
jgi:hypothetical protein